MGLLSSVEVHACEQTWGFYWMTEAGRLLVVDVVAVPVAQPAPAAAPQPVTAEPAPAAVPPPVRCKRRIPHLGRIPNCTEVPGTVWKGTSLSPGPPRRYKELSSIQNLVGVAERIPLW